MNLTDLLSSNNIAKLLSKKKLQEVFVTSKEHYDTDRASRKNWEKSYSSWMSMTLQEIEHKTKPWPGAANIKYPLMTQAALQFNARALPALVPNNEPVGAGKIGPDPTGEKAKIAQSVSGHMNYQLITEMDEWESSFDSLLMALPVSGMEFKKVYYDGTKTRNVARHVTPLKLVVNYYADSLATTRKTEIHDWNKNKIMEGVAAGRYMEPNWAAIGEAKAGKLTEVEVDNAERGGRDEPSITDNATGYVVLEYHCWFDFDEDGYEEPYIVTYMENEQHVLEIIPRYDERVITRTEVSEEAAAAGELGDLIAITPYESYVKYGLIPNPDGSFYDVGFGNLLYPINAVVNTSINMMLDAGASSIMNSGFLGRGIKMRGGMFTMAPNTWMSVNTTGDDIRKSFVPMPTKEPSNVLMSLMTYMVEAGQKVSGTTDIFTGEMPGQNTKTGVTEAVRDEGQKVFTAIYKRLRRTLKEELDLLYELNGIVLGAGLAGENTLIAKSATIFGVTADMYNKDLLNIQPSADPNIAIKEQKMQKDLTVYQMVSESGIGDIGAAQMRVLNTMEVENVEQIQPEGSQAPPDPQVQMAQQDQQMASAQADFDADLATKEFQLKVWQAQHSAQLEAIQMMSTADQAAALQGLSEAKFELEVEQAIEAKNERAEDRAAAAADTGSVGAMEK